MKTDLLGYESFGRLHRVEITHEDLTQAAANTAQAIDVLTLKDGDIVQELFTHLEVPFKDASDAAFNSTALTIGDAGSATRYLGSTQLNENGTEVLRSVGGAVPFVYTGAGVLRLTFASMAEKSLVNIDTGKLVVFARVLETARL